MRVCDINNGDEIYRTLFQVAIERDHATILVGELAALVPIRETIEATRTGATLIQWFKDHLRPSDETTTLHDWLEFHRAPAAQCRRCKAITWENPPPPGPCSAVEMTAAQPESWPQHVKQRAYQIDPECWVSYSGKPKAFKQSMERRRTASLQKARADSAA